MRNNLLLGAAVAALMIPAAASAQETTSAIRGTVTNNGAPVAGAAVKIVNVPSGTVSTATTNADGSFNSTGLRVGGPYTVEVTSDQGNQTVTDIFTVLQSPYDLPIDLAQSAGPDIVVSASRIAGAGTISTGLRTVLTQDDIQKVASVNRDIRDIERRDPLATMDLSNTRAVSFGGVNPRYNRFTINGVQIGDNFGLNSDANPTGRGPVPFDAISQVSTSAVPWDVRQGNFQGGVIDTVLLSGTNEFHGTGFYSLSTDDLQGKTIGSTTTTLAPYKSKTYGATFSGPIIQDKLFFMVSAERNTDPRPLAVTSISQIPGLTQATIDQVTGIANTVYNYNPGGFVTINAQKDEKIVGRVDWNITNGQRLSLSYINAYESSTVAQGTSTSATTPAIGLASDYYQRSVKLKAGIAQLNSDWSDHVSTEARFYYKYNKVGQDSLMGTNFSTFTVCTAPTSVNAGTDLATSCASGTPTVVFGPDLSRQANQLFFDTWGGSFLARFTYGDHQVKALAEVAANRTFNYFLQRVNGVYYFDSIADFQNRTASQFNYANAVSLNPTDAAANFKYQQYTLGLQDDWDVTPDLHVEYGVRYDIYAQRSPIPLNTSLLARTGITNTKTYKGLDNWQPRLSLTWKPTDDLRIRAGVGVFGGGSPDIYLSNSYSNTGVITNQISTVNRATPTGGNALTCTAPYNTPATAGVCTAALNGVTGTSIPAVVNTYLATTTAALATAPTNELDPNFRLPSVTKATLSADYKFFGVNFGADYLYTKTNYGVTFTDLRTVRVGTLPDGRPRYSFLPTPGVTPVQTADTNQDILMTNTTKGRTHIVVLRASKDFDWGLSVGGSYTRQDVKDVAAAASSTASSNYFNNPVSDPNNAAYGIGADEIAWSFKYNVGFDHAFFGDYKTRIQLFGETRAGRRYSYTMQSTSSRSTVFGTLGSSSLGTNSDQRYLIYVPTGPSDPIVSYDSTTTRDSLESIIGSTVLSQYRGQIAPKNIARNRAFTRIDLHLEQQIPTFIGGSRLTVFGDIENLPNLLNHNWGGLRQLAFPQYAALVQVTCLQTAVATGTTPTAAQTTTATTGANSTCAQYRYSTFKTPNTGVVSTNNSLYLIRVGARFTF